VPSGWRRYVRPQDFVWLILFSALAMLSPEPGPKAPVLLIAMGIVQVLEPRIGPRAGIVIQLALSYGLISGGGVNSSFYPILVLPVISAATNFGIRGTTLVTLAACAIYLSFLATIDWKTQYLEREDWFELAIRSMLYPVVGFLTYALAEANRKKTQELETTAAELANANKHLQEAQAEIRRSERLAALGQLTAGLAHELRNPLGTMKSSAELLVRQVDGGNEIAREMAGYIASEVDRTNSLITRFLDFARPQHLRMEKGEIAAMLDRVVAQFEREKSGQAATISVIKNYSPDVPPVPFDSQLLERVLLNLVMNAAQASPPGGVVTIKTRRLETGTGPMVEIGVIDRGSGIDAKNLESIFNPFFTTKAEGVGLGLAIVSKIVDEHGGNVAVESTPGEGSVFRVYLPAR
jgi:two-component system sensor histidine kinase HydH